MKTRYYSWHIDYYNEDNIIIYEQLKEDENSYSCVSHIVLQLLKEQPKYSFNLITQYERIV